MNKEDINYHAYKYAESKQEDFLRMIKHLENYRITTVAYFRFFKNGRYMYLCNNLKWLHFCLTKIHDNSSTSLGKQVGKVVEDSYHCYLWPTDMNDFLMKALHDHEIWNGLSVFKKLEDNSVELWGFATDKNNIMINNFYIENINSIINLTRIFKLQFPNLFRIHSQEVLAVYRDHKEYKENKTEMELARDNIKKFLDKTKIKKYPLIIEGDEYYLTPREFECLRLISYGNSVKEVAVITELSSRSVEKYIDNIRTRTGCKKRKEIIKNFMQSTYKFL